MITYASRLEPAEDALATELAKFPGATSQALRRIGVMRRWRDGDVVLRGGVTPTSVLILLRGKLRVAALSKDGNEVFFRWFLPGEFVGLASVLADRPFPAEAIAVGQFEAFIFESNRLIEHLRTDAEGALYFARMTSRFASEIANLVISQAASALHERIWSVIDRLASHEVMYGTGQDVKLMVSQQDIASAVSASRPRVSIELRKLESSGRIRLGYRHLVVLSNAQFRN